MLIGAVSPEAVQAKRTVLYHFSFVGLSKEERIGERGSGKKKKKKEKEKEKENRMKKDSMKPFSTSK